MCWGEDFFFGFAVEIAADGVDVVWVVGLRVVEAHDAISGTVEVSGDDV